MLYRLYVNYVLHYIRVSGQRAMISASKVHPLTDVQPSGQILYGQNDIRQVHLIVLASVTASFDALLASSATYFAAESPESALNAPVPIVYQVAQARASIRNALSQR